MFFFKRGKTVTVKYFLVYRQDVFILCFILQLFIYLFSALFFRSLYVLVSVVFIQLSNVLVSVHVYFCFLLSF